jgi:hypothetical protein
LEGKRQQLSFFIIFQTEDVNKVIFSYRGEKRVGGEKERKKKRWRERKKERKKGGGRERKKERKGGETGQQRIVYI